MVKTIEDKLKEIIAECGANVKLEEINKESDLVLDFGFRSMNFIQLVAELELQFDIEFDEDNLLLECLSNFGTLLRVIEGKVTK